MNSKFARQPRIQPTPAICKRPWPDLAPGAQWASIQAVLRHDEPTGTEGPVHFLGIMLLMPMPPVDPTTWSGSTTTADGTASIIIYTNPSTPIGGPITVDVLLTFPGPYTVALTTTFPREAERPTTARPIKKWAEQPLDHETCLEIML